MNTARFVRGVVLSLATFGTCVPEIACAAELPTPPVLDVALRDGGVLQGRVVNLQGSGVPGTSVTLRAGDRTVAAGTTAADGSFRAEGLKGGMYQVVTVQGQGIYRLWSAGTAPPAAQSEVIVYTQNRAVDSRVVVYTQNCCNDGCCNSGCCGGCCSDGCLKMLLCNPIVIGGLVATAVAVPVALNQWHHSPVSP
jgi:hypothetical protein